VTVIRDQALSRLDLSRETFENNSLPSRQIYAMGSLQTRYADQCRRHLLYETLSEKEFRLLSVKYKDAGDSNLMTEYELETTNSHSATEYYAISYVSNGQ
jgi:hypothetical protein